MFHIVWDEQLKRQFITWCTRLPHYLQGVVQSCLGEFVTRFSNDPYAELIQEDHHYPGLYTWEFGDILPLRFAFKINASAKIVELYKIEGTKYEWDHI